MPSSTHALFIPYPAQGHVLPLLELAYRFADHGRARLETVPRASSWTGAVRAMFPLGGLSWLIPPINYPDGFPETVEKRGKIVTWSPQHRLLAHPVVACFVSHCGWNSVTEGMRNGLPFLTWPYFADQFVDESYVCDVWKTGLRLVKDAGGVVTSEHIAARIENLLKDPTTMSRALELQQAASRSIGEDGTSFNNLTAVINAMKG